MPRGARQGATMKERAITMFAGGLAGVVSRTATAPLERLKVFMQVNGTSPYGAGVLGSVYQMIKTEGIRGSLRGNGVNCVKVLPTSSVKFLAFETFKRALMPPGAKQLPAGRKFIVGACSGVISTVLTHPLDVARTRITLQVGRSSSADKYKGIMGTLSTMVAEEGIRSLFTGVTASIVNVAPFNAINFAAYELVKEAVESRVRVKSVLLSSAYGAISGCVAMSVMYPLDVVKRTMMATARKRTASGAVVGNITTVGTARSIYSTQGIRGFYRGIIPSYAKVVPTVSLTWFTYETAKKFLL
ncbi:phosphoadenosine-5'-phosphosulfate (PAPS) transporter, mitochondrial [Pelomyxa schiedti]|nr:phosphoadenosine-5'-phosphosulfate (PAPS) transporter, mitochondrial [Pelomyxa schiedti]